MPAQMQYQYQSIDPKPLRPRGKLRTIHGPFPAFLATSTMEVVVLGGKGGQDAYDIWQRDDVMRELRCMCEMQPADRIVSLLIEEGLLTVFIQSNEANQ